jgi:hypothetical protein
LSGAAAGAIAGAGAWSIDGVVEVVASGLAVIGGAVGVIGEALAAAGALAAGSLTAFWAKAAVAMAAIAAVETSRPFMVFLMRLAPRPGRLTHGLPEGSAHRFSPTGD